MNVLSANRALRASREKVEALEARRANAKDKPRWDEKNGNKLHTSRMHMVRLITLLQAALAAQGQYTHRSPDYSPPETETEDE